MREVATADAAESPAAVDAPTRSASRIAAPAPRTPRLAIVIDDVGWNRDAGRRVIALPGPLTLAVLPGTPVGTELSRAGFLAGHEIILHQPMAPVGAEAPGPGALLPDSSDDDVARIVAANLAAVPHRVGLSNHMGSLLTSRPDAMQQLMRSVAAQGIYFLDSRTTPVTVALDAARVASVPAIPRDVFLDNEPDQHAIEAALDAALALAARRGHAIAIGHPRPDTLLVLERRLPLLREQVELVPVSALVSAAAAAESQQQAERTEAGAGSMPSGG